MLYYMPYHEYEVYSAIFCIIRPVPDVSRLFHYFLCTYSYNIQGGPRNFQLALILMYNSLKERSFEDHCNVPLIFVLVQILTILFHF